MVAEAVPERTIDNDETSIRAIINATTKRTRRTLTRMNPIPSLRVGTAGLTIGYPTTLVTALPRLARVKASLFPYDPRQRIRSPTP